TASGAPAFREYDRGSPSHLPVTGTHACGFQSELRGLPSFPPGFSPEHGRRLFFNTGPDLVGIYLKLRIALDLQRPRPRDVNRDRLLDMRGTLREDQNPVSKKDCFVDIVRDEHGRFSSFGPDLDELGLHEFSRLRVQAAER